LATVECWSARLRRPLSGRSGGWLLIKPLAQTPAALKLLAAV